MITDAQYLAWLDSDTAARCLLVEADYRDTGTNATGTEYLATIPFVSKPTDTPANRVYLSLVKEIPQFQQSMSDVVIGRTTANVGRITMQGGTAETDAWLFGRDWIGRSLRLYIGDASWPKADFRSLAVCVIANFTLSGTNEIVFEARDLQHLLNQPIKRDVFESGPLVGMPAPVVVGDAYNAPCVLLDSATHKYRVSDGSISAIGAVRAAGKAAAFTADLIGGTFTLSAAPDGPVTADVSNATAGSQALDNASDIIKYFVTQRGYLTVDQLDIDSFNALKIACPQKLGMFVPAADMMVYDAVDKVSNTIGAFTAINRDGKLFVRRFEFGGTSVLTITQNDIEPHGLTVERVIAPVASVRIAARTNNAVGQTLIGGASGATEDNVALYQNGALQFGGAVPVNAGLGLTLKNSQFSNPSPVSTSGSKDYGTLPSLFVSGADAQAESNRRAAMWGVTRYVLSVKCVTPPLRLKLGDTITIKHPRYQLAAGKDAILIGITEQPSRKRVALRVMI